MNAELPLGYIQDMHSALAIATEPKRFREAAEQVSELIKRSEARGLNEHEVEFRARLIVLQERLLKAEEGPQVGVVRHLGALDNETRRRILNRYCAFCGACVVGSRCTCYKDD
jgi:hypothetical protein